jgi:hypothetical protein
VILKIALAAASQLWRGGLLIALHARYGLPMQGLAQFETPQNSSWFRAPEKYWHERVFGESSDPSSRFVRSPFVRWLTDGGER